MGEDLPFVSEPTCVAGEVDRAVRNYFEEPPSARIASRNVCKWYVTEFVRGCLGRVHAR